MMVRKLSVVAAMAATVFVSASAVAGPKCPGELPKLDQDKVRQMFQDKGYEIKRFKVSSGGCYEIYGMQAGKKVEVYIDPWTADELQKSTN